MDQKDYKTFGCFNWYYNKGYAARSSREGGKQHIIFLHQEIMGKKIGLDVDHINGDPLDNRRCNLRHVTRKQNLWNQGFRTDNTSGYKGVCWSKKAKKWVAGICVEGKSVHLGCFILKKDAAIAYNEFAKDYRKEFARLNKI